MIMQKLSGELKNVSTDAPLVCSSTRSVLNKDESPSAQDIVLTDNNLEVDLAVLKGSAIKLESIYQKNLSFNFNIIFGKINNKAIHPKTKVMGFLAGRS